MLGWLALPFLAVLLVVLIAARLMMRLCGGPDNRGGRRSRWVSVLGLATASLGAAGFAWVAAGYASSLGLLVVVPA